MLSSRSMSGLGLGTVLSFTQELLTSRASQSAMQGSREMGPPIPAKKCVSSVSYSGLLSTAARSLRAHTTYPTLHVPVPAPHSCVVIALRHRGASGRS